MRSKQGGGGGLMCWCDRSLCYDEDVEDEDENEDDDADDDSVVSPLI